MRCDSTGAWVEYPWFRGESSVYVSERLHYAINLSIRYFGNERVHHRLTFDDFGDFPRWGKSCEARHDSASFVLARIIAVMPARSASGRSGQAVTNTARSGHFPPKCAKKHAKFSKSES